MSEQLSFTQALRENGFTKTGENTQTNNNEDTTEKTEQKIEEIEEKEISNEETTKIQEEVSNDNTPEENDAEGNVLFIGTKSVMNYVLTIVTMVNEGENKIIIKARGRAINRAVDVVEVARHRFITDLKIDDISISTQHITRDDGRESNVSAICITLIK